MSNIATKNFITFDQNLSKFKIMKKNTHAKGISRKRIRTLLIDVG
jgi:hypothetical protein